MSLTNAIKITGPMVSVNLLVGPESEPLPRDKTEPVPQEPSYI